MGPYTEEMAQRYKYWLDIERPGELEFIDRYAQLSGGPILELASGAARVTKELARRGHIVYGVEMSRPMLDKAREVVGRMDARIRDRIRLVQGDMTRFAFGRKFPLIVIPFYSLWHNLDEKGAYACVRCMVEHMAPGGLFLVEGEHDFCESEHASRFWSRHAPLLGIQFRFERYAMHSNMSMGSFLIGERR